MLMELQDILCNTYNMNTNVVRDTQKYFREPVYFKRNRYYNRTRCNLNKLTY